MARGVLYDEITTQPGEGNTDAGCRTQEPLKHGAASRKPGIKARELTAPLA